MSKDTQAPDHNEQGGADGLDLAQRNILIVDDDEIIRVMIQEMLELQGYQTMTAATPQVASDILQQHGPHTLGLVITDIHLTDNPSAQEGYVLYTCWSARYPALPFLLISGDPSSPALPAIQTGAVPFLAKPFTLTALLHMVQHLFRS